MTRRTINRLPALTIALLLTVAACANPGGGDPPSAEPVSDPVVTIAGMDFVDGDVTVEVGTTVTWVWDDAPIEHNVVFDDDEGPLQAEGTWSRTFDRPGTYEYECGPHPHMQGTITVVEPAAA